MNFSKLHVKKIFHLPSYDVNMDQTKNGAFMVAFSWTKKTAKKSGNVADRRALSRGGIHMRRFTSNSNRGLRFLGYAGNWKSLPSHYHLSSMRLSRLCDLLSMRSEIPIPHCSLFTLFNRSRFIIVFLLSLFSRILG